jgi:hypothetical protein
MFKNSRLARMSDGHYCLVRDLGLVKGGKGLRCHEVVVDFSFRGMKLLAKQGAAELARRMTAQLERRKGASKWPALLRLREPQ